MGVDSGPSDIRRAEIVALLAVATSLAVGQPWDFGLRSCILSMQFATRLGLKAAERDTLYWYALLRFLGCNAENHALSDLFGDEIALSRRYLSTDTARPAEVLPLLVGMMWRAHADRGPLAALGAVAAGLLAGQSTGVLVAAGHCDVAQRLAVRLEFGDAVIEALGQGRERWDGKGLPRGLAGEQVMQAVRLVGLCQDVLMLMPLLGRDATLRRIADRQGIMYEPALVEAFLPIAGALLDDVEAADAWTDVLALEVGAPAHLDAQSADDAYLVIADFCDLKLPDAINHSRAVATLAETAGAALGLPADELLALRHAALLHDLGYAALPVRARGGHAAYRGAGGDIKLHPFHGEEMLMRLPALRRAAALVGRHHEAGDGSGYYRGLSGTALTSAARLLIAAEFYQTAREGRFGRPPLDASGAAAAMRAEVTAGHVDGDAAKAVLAAAGHKVPIKRRDLIAGLTNRELDILRLAATGLSTKQIGARLGISPKTADNHLQNLYPKIEVKTRAGATLFAIEHGLCALPK